MAGTLIIILLIAFFSYAFAGILAFVPFLIGLFYGFFKTGLDLIKFNLYPVADFVYLGVAGIMVFCIVYYVIKLFAKHN